MRTLFVSDLDGTLLNRDSILSPYTCRTLERLTGEGMLFTYATARSIQSASVAAQGFMPKIPAVYHNGVFLIEPWSGKVLESVTFSEKQRQELKDIFEEYRIAPIVFSLIDGRERASWDTTRENEGIQWYLVHRKNDRRLRPLGDSRGLFDGIPFTITYIGERESLENLHREFLKRGYTSCVFQQELYRAEYWLEVMPNNASKAKGIQHLKDLLQCDRIISFGDALNDIPMFQASDQCYAVENAVQPLKKTATGIIGSNQQDGVAKWLENHWQKI